MSVAKLRMVADVIEHGSSITVSECLSHVRIQGLCSASTMHGQGT